MLRIETFVVSPIGSNCYVVSTEQGRGADAVIIDPGDPHLDPVFAYIEAEALNVVALWCTHGHFDHVLGVDVVRQKFRVPAYVHEADGAVWNAAHQSAKRWLHADFDPVAPPDHTWQDGDTAVLGSTSWRVMHTPGHSPGSICLVGEETAFTGDTLFAGSIGRTDLDHSDPDAMRDSLARLLTLSDGLTLYPGHMERTTMAVERQSNPFLRRIR